LGDAGGHAGLVCGGVGGAEDVVAVGGGGGERVVGKFGGNDVARGVWVARWGWCARGWGGSLGKGCGGEEGEQSGGAEEVGHGRLRWCWWLAAAGLNVYPRRLTLRI